jgi:hypothetical protein
MKLDDFTIHASFVQGGHTVPPIAPLWWYGDALICWSVPIALRFWSEDGEKVAGILTCQYGGKFSSMTSSYANHFHNRISVAEQWGHTRIVWLELNPLTTDWLREVKAMEPHRQLAEDPRYDGSTWTWTYDAFTEITVHDDDGYHDTQPIAPAHLGIREEILSKYPTFFRD